jgi:hypothetical protein
MESSPIIAIFQALGMVETEGCPAI